MWMQKVPCAAAISAWVPRRGWAAAMCAGILQTCSVAWSTLITAPACKAGSTAAGASFLVARTISNGVPQA